MSKIDFLDCYLSFFRQSSGRGNHENKLCETGASQAFRKGALGFSSLRFGHSSVFALKMSGFLFFLSVVVFGFFLINIPFSVFMKTESGFLVLVYFCFLVSRVFLVHVVRRHPGDVPGESGPQKAVEVLRNFIAISLK